MSEDKKPTSYIERLLAELRERGLQIPSVLVGEPKPLALPTRSDLPAWCSARGYDEAAVRALNKAIGAHVRSGSYREAVASDLSQRFALDGETVAGEVSETDRHSAALLLHTRALRDQGKQKAAAPGGLSLSSMPSAPAQHLASTLGLLPQQEQRTSSMPGPQAQQTRNLRAGGVLTPGELERRRAVLAGIKK